jgi:CxxC-x17-CxxC domain-containing protein
MGTIQDKKAGRSRGRAVRKRGLMRSVRCAACGRREMVPFVPKKGKPVLCRKCREKFRGD